MLKDENASLKKQLKKLQEEITNINNDSLHRMNESITLRKSLTKLKKKIFSYKQVQKSQKMHLFYTGISKSIFAWLLKQLTSNGKLYRAKGVLLRDHLLMVLIKLRLGLKNSDIAYRFGIDFTKVFRN